MSILLDPMNAGGTRGDAPVIDPTATASQIALLKGLLKQLQGAGSGNQPVTIQNAAGAEIFTTAEPGRTDLIDKATRALGKVSADDGAIVSAGAKSDVAVIDPTESASMIALLKGLLKQLQGAGIGQQSVLDQTDTVTSDLSTEIVTITSTPIALSQGKVSSKGVVIKNLSQFLQARFGEPGMTPANGKGLTLEPGEKVIITFDPNIATNVYVWVDGAAIQLEVAWI